MKEIEPGVKIKFRRKGDRDTILATVERVDEHGNVFVVCERPHVATVCKTSDIKEVITGAKGE